jgi:hypothetical protein
MILPKIYNDEGGKYPQFKGFPKLSYSQYTSFKSELYKEQYLKGYFFGIRDEGNVWSGFGSDVGNFIEIQGTTKDFSEYTQGVMTLEEDKEFLRGLDYPENSVYEDEIVLPVKDTKGKILFVVQGFLDRCEYRDKEVYICDFKTGNLEKKIEFYGSKEYGQTTLYSHCKSLEGFKVKESFVLLLGRKGNGRGKHTIRLSGETAKVDTPYTLKKGKEVVASMTKVAKKISKYYEVYQKLIA